MLFRSNKMWVFFDVCNQSSLVCRHPEEIGLLVYLFERQTRCWILVVGQRSIRFCNKRLLSYVVPPGVSVKIHIAIISTPLPKLLGSALVTVRGGPDVVVVRDENTLIETLETCDIL